MTLWIRFLLVLIPSFLWGGGGLWSAPFVMPEKMEDLMANYCFDCHDDETKKGEVRLDNLATLALKDRLDLLNRVQEQIFIKEMPPEKRKAKPSDSEHRQIICAISYRNGLRHGNPFLIGKLLENACFSTCIHYWRLNATGEPAIFNF